jgi:hypothetical protein
VRSIAMREGCFPKGLWSSTLPCMGVRLTAKASRATHKRRAEVVGFPSGGRVLVRLDDGRAIEVPLLDGMRNRCEVGSPVLIYFDDQGTLMGWYLPTPASAWTCGGPNDVGLAWRMSRFESAFCPMRACARCGNLRRRTSPYEGTAS